MPSKLQYKDGWMRIYNTVSHEMFPLSAPRLLYDDFEGTVLNTNIWTDLDLNGATTTAPVLSYFDCSIGAVNENAAAGLYGGDNKSWNIDKGLNFEVRLAIHTAPTLTTEIGFGVMNDSYGVDSMRFMIANECAKYAFFGFYTTSGAGLIPIIRTSDGTAVSGIVSTAIPAVALDAFHTYRMSFLNPASVEFFIDGARVAPATTFKMNTAANLMVQPWIVIYKHDDPTTAAAGQFYLDSVKIWQKR